MKKIFIVAIIFIITFLISGCFENKQEISKRRQYFSQARENAINYIQEKYNFNPKIVKTECTHSNEDMFSSSCNKYIIVTAEYNRRRFQILIDGSKPTQYGYDNYQFKEIESGILDLINENIGKPYRYQLYFGYDNKGMINEYYDGKNLIDILSPFSNKLILLVEYIDIDNMKEINNKLNSYPFSIFYKLYIVNYKSLSSYNKTKSHDYNIRGSYEESIFYDNSKNLKEVLTKVYSEIKYYNF